jgi:hypothetical protein
MLSQNLRRTARSAAWVAAAMFILQPQFLLAEPTPAAGELPIRVVDVALGNNGVLYGQILDRQGRQLPITQIQLTNGVRQWDTYTDEEGNFRVEGLVGSTYQVHAAGQTQIVRAWAPDTAPPGAAQGLLLVHDSSVVLGQHCGSPVCGSPVCGGGRCPLASPLIVGGLIAAAIAIPVAIHNSDDDNDDPGST